MRQRIEPLARVHTKGDARWEKPATEFERPRGISGTSVTKDFAHVAVTALADQRRIIVRALADEGISFDFLKLRESGFDFLVAERDEEAAGRALGQHRVDHEITSGKVIVTVEAVNMREEEGLIAGILSQASLSGAPITLVGDQHDKVLIVTTEEGAEKITECLKS